MIEARDAWILPGLIEAHAHIGITEETRGSIDDDCNEISGPIQPQLRAIDAINPMDPAFHDAIRAGITSVMTGPGSANEGCLRGKSQGQLWGFRYCAGRFQLRRMPIGRMIFLRRFALQGSLRWI